MNKINEVIEQSNLEFDYRFRPIDFCNTGDNKMAYVEQIRDEIKYFISQRDHKILSAIEEEVKGRKIEQPEYGMDNYEHAKADQAFGVNSTISDILALLKSAKEIK